MPPFKRRKISEEDANEGAVQPTAVVSTCSSPVEEGEIPAVELPKFNAEVRKEVLLQPAGMLATSPTPAADFQVPALEAIPRIMMVELPKDNAEDVVVALRMLQDLLHHENGGVENGKEATKMGMAYALLTTLRKWCTDDEISTASCDCLGLLACTMKKDDGEVSVAKLGGMELITNAMKRFPESSEVQRSCLFVLRNLLAGSINRSQASRDVMQNFVDHLSGISLVVNAMTSFGIEEPFYDFLQAHGCAVLCNIAFFKEAHDALHKSTAVAAVEMAAKQHPEHDEVPALANCFLETLLFDEDAQAKW